MRGGRSGALKPGRAALTAGALSVCLHAALLAAWRGPQRQLAQPQPTRARPLAVEVLRVVGLVEPRRSTLFEAAGFEASRPAPQAATGPRGQPGPGAAAAPGEARAQTVASPPAQPGPGAAAAPGEDLDQPSGPKRDPGLGAAGPDETGAADPPALAVGRAGGAGSTSPGGLDTADLSRRLQEGALRCYPRASRRFLQQGEVKVRFCLDGAGTLHEASVATSSGFEGLDLAATRCVVPGAAPFGPETFGRCFTLPVRFHQ